MFRGEEQKHLEGIDDSDAKTRSWSRTKIRRVFAANCAIADAFQGTEWAACGGGIGCRAAPAGGGGDDGPAGMETKKGNKKKGKGKKGAESDDDEPPAPEPAKQLTKAQERKAKKKGKNRGDSTDEDEPAPAPADDDAPKKPSRAELRKHTQEKI